MIHLVPSLTLDGCFSVQDLPDALQLPLLNSMVVPRIVSSSMTPTIQQGDRLELRPATSLTVGAIVVYRHDTMLVCHRIIAVDPQGMLSTRGDATQGTCEIVQRSSIIGVVTGVLREDNYLSLGQHPHPTSPSAREATFKSSSIRTGIIRSTTQVLRVFARASFFQHMLANVLRWTATVDVLAPAPLSSLPSCSQIASFTLRRTPSMGTLLVASNGQNSTRHVLRLGPWRLAQYDPTTESLLLRQSLHDAGLEPFVRRICSGHQTISE